jgi:hypothetical protein
MLLLALALRPNFVKAFMKKLLFMILVSLVSVTEHASAGESAIALSIAVPVLAPGKERSIVAFDRHSHFAVIIINVSDKPQRVVAEGNSWGDQALSFEITDKSGKKFLARRVETFRAKNMLHWWVLQPQESMVLDVYFEDSQKWQGFPQLTRYGDSEALTMTAAFEVKPNKVPPKDGLWTGRVVSKPETYLFANRRTETK